MKTITPTWVTRARQADLPEPLLSQFVEQRPVRPLVDASSAIAAARLRDVQVATFQRRPPDPLVETKLVYLSYPMAVCAAARGDCSTLTWLVVFRTPDPTRGALVVFIDAQRGGPGYGYAELPLRGQPLPTFGPPVQPGLGVVGTPQCKYMSPNGQDVNDQTPICPGAPPVPATHSPGDVQISPIPVNPSPVSAVGSPRP